MSQKERKIVAILDKIKMVPFPRTQYMNETSHKQQLYIHHTASSANPYNVIEYWKSTSERVATSFIIGRENFDNEIIQIFNSSKWGWHLGLASRDLKKGNPGAKTNTELNKMSIGIELCNWGQLTLTDDGFQNYKKGIVPDNEVCELSESYREFKYYQKYTDKQLDILAELLKYLGDKWDIPVAYKGDRIFNICPDALRGTPGIWSHVSVRADKVDCSPQPNLITMLKAL